MQKYPGGIFNIRTVSTEIYLEPPLTDGRVRLVHFFQQFSKGQKDGLKDLQFLFCLRDLHTLYTPPSTDNVVLWPPFFRGTCNCPDACHDNTHSSKTASLLVSSWAHHAHPQEFDDIRIMSFVNVGLYPSLVRFAADIPVHLHEALLLCELRSLRDLVLYYIIPSPFEVSSTRKPFPALDYLATPSSLFLTHASFPKLTRVQFFDRVSMPRRDAVLLPYPTRAFERRNDDIPNANVSLASFLAALPACCHPPQITAMSILLGYFPPDELTDWHILSRFTSLSSFQYESSTFHLTPDGDVEAIPPTPRGTDPSVWVKVRVTDPSGWLNHNVPAEGTPWYDPSGWQHEFDSLLHNISTVRQLDIVIVDMTDVELPTCDFLRLVRSISHFCPNVIRLGLEVPSSISHCRIPSTIIPHPTLRSLYLPSRLEDNDPYKQYIRETFPNALFWVGKLSEEESESTESLMLHGADDHWQTKAQCDWLVSFLPPASRRCCTPLSWRLENQCRR